MRMLIADDHDLVRETIVLFLNGMNDMHAEWARDKDHAIEVVRANGPFDLVLLDLTMPGMNGLEGLKALLAEPNARQVALMSGSAPRDVVEAALGLGAIGFLPKTLGANSMANAVRFMAMGEKYAPVDFMTTAAPPTPSNKLTRLLSSREVQVLNGLCLGKSNKEIARLLALMEPTVKLHVRTLYRKIGANNRTQAVILAKDAGVC
jgi:two-component system, NarL family, nitrate/nitrite response regulator NarL